MTRQLLAISWEMPPLSGPRAVQVTRTLRALSTLGWRSRVVCFGPRSNRYNQDYDARPEAETGGAVQLLRVPSPEEWLLFRALWRVCPPIKRLPDEKRVWIGRALRVAREAIADARPDVVISFAQPWSDHLIGLELRRETGLPWVAHFSDPWVDNSYARGARWQRRIWERMERDVIAHADRIVFVNRRTADRVMAKYPPAWSQKVCVVPQGYEPRCDQPSATDTSGPLRMVYTGRFYDGFRSPDTLLTALARLNEREPLVGRLEVLLVGGAMEPYRRRSAQLGLADIVTFTGRRSPADANAIAATADVLLVIDSPSDGPNLFLPSKLIDYLPLCKPIFGITPAEGASADLLARLGYPTADPSTPSAIAAEIDRLLRVRESGELRASDCHAHVSRQYDIRATTASLNVMLEEILSADTPA